MSSKETSEGEGDAGRNNVQERMKKNHKTQNGQKMGKKKFWFKIDLKHLPK